MAFSGAGSLWSWNSRRPLPTTIGQTSSRSSSSRPWRNSQATSVGLPVMLMFFPGCRFSSPSFCATSPLSRVELRHSTSSRVVETTSLGMLLM
jgi:hypothetical protein